MRYSGDEVVMVNVRRVESRVNGNERLAGYLIKNVKNEFENN